MVRIRHGMTWCRRGISLLWSPDALATFADPAEVISIRQLFAMARDWPEVLPSAGGDAVVVAGAEGCIDSLDGAEAERWIAEDLRQIVMGFQEHYEGGAALVLWIPSGRPRIIMHGASEHYYMRHRAYSDGRLPIGRLLCSGAENEIERIMMTEDRRADPDGPHWAGLYHPRIS